VEKCAIPAAPAPKPRSVPPWETAHTLSRPFSKAATAKAWIWTTSSLQMQLTGYLEVLLITHLA
jgi:hypothetical protein